MMLPTLYVAGPMTGKPQFNYPHFMEVTETLTDCGYRVLNPAEVDNLHRAEEAERDVKCAECYHGRKHEWDWYMRRTIKMLMDAQAIALLRGWEQSRGAKLEVALATQLGMPFRPWQSWVLDVRGDDDTKPGTRRKKEAS
jgi:hypothetical protein